MTPAVRIAVWSIGTVLAVGVGSSDAAVPAVGAWQAGAGHRWRELSVPANGRTFLQRLPATTTGLSFTNYLSEEKGLENDLRTTGAGVAAGDVDGDGWCDLYFCGMENNNTLYRNLGGWKFEDVTTAAGVACEGDYSAGAVFADVDGDGDLDLLVTSLGGGTRLFFNDGKGRFSEATDSGLVRRFGATSMALADIDGNGTLDLYVCNYSTTKIEDRPNARFDARTVNGKMVLTAIDGVPMTSPDLTNRYFVDAGKVVRELGEPDILYVNDGRGKFRAVPETGGAFLDEEGKPLGRPLYDFGLSVMFRDMNGDLAPDIYVCNDLFPPDRIWVNDGRGGFRAMSNLAVRETCRFAMGVDFADFNRDGLDDFFVVDMLSRSHARRKMQTVGTSAGSLPVGKIDTRAQYKRNMLFLSRGDGTYAEIAQLAGLDATEWSWMPAFLDLDLDGYEDVLVTTGHIRDSLHADAVATIMKLRTGRKLSDLEHRALKQKHYPVLRVSNQAFRNRGDLTFEDKATDWGFDYVGISHGLCLADLDNDGDQDVVVIHLNDVVGVYRHESAAPRVAVRLAGQAPNTRGIGAKIRLLGGPMPQTQEMICGGRYLSGDENVRMFACGNSTGGMSLEVTWRNGKVGLVKDVQPNRVYEVEETAAVSPARPAVRQDDMRGPTLFSDVSSLLRHTHQEAPFNDFEVQPMLPRRFSQLGPGVSWFDLDGDGWEDLTIGSGTGGRMAVYRNDGRGGLAPWEAEVLKQPVSRDQTTPLGWRRTDGSNVMLVGSAVYEDTQPGGACVREFDLGKPAVGGRFPAWEISPGPMSMADLDGDGTLDLFVGGRIEPRRYPDSPSSLMFRGTGSQFEIDEGNCKRLGLTGMVSGCVFSDLDGDGDPDLILACEWGPIRIFRNEAGKLSPWAWNVAVGVDAPETGRRFTHLDQLTGWWNGVASGDLDGDGRLDLVAGNWGRNSKYEAHRSKPLRVVFGEFTVKGIVDVFDSYEDRDLKKLVPWGTYSLARLFPWIVERYDTQTAFSTAGTEEILGDRVTTARTLQATWLESALFLNRGDHFEVRALPMEAQFSPALAVNVADLTGDGNEDVFVGQNFFAVDGDTSRYDAGRGLLLAGDGKGILQPMSGQDSGLKIYGEQRGAALCDYDGDGRVDLVVSQNAAETKLYRNTGAKAGLRVRLSGPPGNPHGVGAALRLLSGPKAGPVREIHSGSGYWSQDASVQILSAGEAEAATRLWVRWPGGKAVTTEVPPGAKEIVVDSAGKLVRSR